MKKTITINLSGMVFHLDEDAYELLSNYLDRLKSKFTDELEAREILDDIENRIAELLTEKIRDRQIVSVGDIQEIISMIGEPEEIEDSGTTFKEKKSQSDKSFRRMYRDPDNRILGGVCGGMAAYFNLDASLIRIVFVIILLLSFGTALVAYLIFWFIIPEAKTRAQKLEMKGQHVNLENLEKAVKDELNAVKENLRKFNFPEKLKNLGYSLEKSLINFGKGILTAFKSLRIFIGIILILCGIVLVIAFSGSFWSDKLFISASSFLTSSFSLPHLLQTITNPSLATFLTIGIILVAVIPLIWIIFSGVKLVFHIRSHDRIFNMLTSFLFLSGIVIIIISVIMIGRDFKSESRVIRQEIFPQISNDTIYIGIKPVSDKNNFYFLKTDELKIFTTKSSQRLMISPTYKIKKSYAYFVTIEKEIISRGSNSLDASANIENVVFNIYSNKDSLQFSPYFTIDENQKYRGQWLSNTIYIPVGKYIWIDESLKNAITDYEGNKKLFPDNFFNKYLKMTSKGLILPQ